MDRIKVAQAFIEKIKNEYPDDISLVVLCGSYVYNDIHEKSDLDFYFIPKTQRGYELATTFLIEDISFDFWGLSWERATSMANYDEENVSIIVGGRVIYYSSDEDLERFRSLQLMGQQFSDEDFRKKSLRELNKCYGFFFDMLCFENDLHNVKSMAINILRTLSFSIALLNCTCVKRGWGKLLSEINAMEIVPVDFGKLYLSLLESNNCADIIQMSKQIIKNTKDAIDSKRPEKAGLKFTDTFSNFYEEMKSYYYKIIHACEINDYQTVVLASSALENLIISLLKATSTDFSKLPKLLTSINTDDLKDFISLIELHEKCFLEILKNNNVTITQYENIEMFLSKFVNE